MIAVILKAMQSLRRQLPHLIIFFLLFALFLTLLRPWIYVTGRPMPAALYAFLGIFLLVACAGQRLLRSSYNLVLASCLTAIYVTFTPVMLGDPWENILRDLPPNLLWGSSVLSHLLYKAVYACGVQVGWVACVAGFFSALLFFQIADEQLGLAQSKERAFSRLFYLASALHLLFLRGFTEVTIPSVPPAMLSMLFLGRYLKSARERDFICSLVCFSFACLFHGQNTFFFPAFAMMAATVVDPRKNFRPWLRLAGLSLAVPLAVSLLTLLPLCLFYKIIQGDINGGANGQMLVSASSLLQPIHWWRVLNILLIAAPCLPLAYAALPSLIRLRHTPRNFLALSLLFALAYISLVSLWEFDLGFPADFDLMVSVCFPLLLFLLYPAMTLLRRAPAAAYAWLIMALWSSWHFIYLFVVQKAG